MAGRLQRPQSSLSAILLLQSPRDCPYLHDNPNLLYFFKYAYNPWWAGGPGPNGVKRPITTPRTSPSRTVRTSQMRVCLGLCLPLGISRTCRKASDHHQHSSARLTRGQLRSINALSAVMRLILLPRHVLGFCNRWRVLTENDKEARDVPGFAHGNPDDARTPRLSTPATV